MMDLKNFTIEKLSSLIKAKELSSHEVTSAYIRNIEQNDGKLNAFITKTFDLAIKRSKEIDSKSKEELSQMMIPGVVFAAKDVFCTKDIRTTCGSKILEDFIPSYESTITNRLNSQGAIMIGKTNMDEFSMGSAGITSAFGSTVNLLQDKTRPNEGITPGGSSSGSAVAVQANFSSFSIGGDTGGSIKEPASFCGVIGYRPTYGSISRYGQIAYSSSLDQPGFLTKTINDIAILSDITFGYDSKDTSMSKRKFDTLYDKIIDIDSIKKKKFRIAVPRNTCFNSISEPVRKAWEKSIEILSKNNCEIIETELKYIEHAIDVYAIITMVEASSNLARFDGIKFGHREKFSSSLEDLYHKTRSYGFGKEVKGRIISGAFAACSENYKNFYYKACQMRMLFKECFDEIFEKADVILMPPVASVAFGLSDKQNQKEMWLTDLFTLPSNLAGLGGLVVPILKDELTDLPVGMQIISQRFHDIKMFEVGRILEDAIKFSI